MLHSNRVKISKFSLPWQQGSSEQSLTDTIEFTDSENPEMGYLVLVLILKYIFYVLVLVLVLASEVLVLVLVLGT